MLWKLCLIYLKNIPWFKTYSWENEQSKVCGYNEILVAFWKVFLIQYQIINFSSWFSQPPKDSIIKRGGCCLSNYMCVYAYMCIRTWKWRCPQGHEACDPLHLRGRHFRCTWSFGCVLPNRDALQKWCQLLSPESARQPFLTNSNLSISIPYWSRQNGATFGSFKATIRSTQNLLMHKLSTMARRLQGLRNQGAFSSPHQSSSACPAHSFSRVLSHLFNSFLSGTKWINLHRLTPWEFKWEAY